MGGFVFGALSVIHVKCDHKPLTGSRCTVL
jgi:hypothetical protein